MASTLEQRIEKLEKKLKQEKARKAAMEARARAKSLKEQRAAETRGKILLGAWLMNIMSKDGVTAQNLVVGKHRLSDYITRDDDRKVFGLEPLAKPAQAPAAPAVSAAAPVQPQVIAARPSFDDFVNTPRAPRAA